jgi:hypothetical protein
MANAAAKHTPTAAELERMHALYRRRLGRWRRVWGRILLGDHLKEPDSGRPEFALGDEAFRRDMARGPQPVAVRARAGKSVDESKLTGFGVSGQ